MQECCQESGEPAGLSSAGPQIPSPEPVLLSKERPVMCARENQKQLERLMCCWHAELVELRQSEVGYCQ